MKNIRHIFRSDIRRLLKHFFALAVAIGLCLLPALYAWFNIYANWDPYANTGNIKIAVANEDTGFTDEFGNAWTIGDNVVESLKKSTSIGWTFLDSGEEAKQGVEAGTYYAAIVFDPDFSRTIYNGTSSGAVTPEIIYYVNDKKNAVATKITDTAVSSVQTSINEEYVKTVATRFLSGLQEETDISEQSDAVSVFVRKLTDVKTNLSDYSKMIDTFLTGNETLETSLSGADDVLSQGNALVESGNAVIANGQAQLNNGLATFRDLNSRISANLSTVKDSLATLASRISSAVIEEDVNALKADVDSIVDDANGLIGHLDALAQDLAGLDPDEDETVEDVKNRLEKAEQLLTDFVEIIAEKSGVRIDADSILNTADGIHTSLSAFSDTVEKIRQSYVDHIAPSVETLLSSMTASLTSLQTMLTNLGNVTDGIGDVFDRISSTLSIMDTSMTDLKAVLDSTMDQLDTIIAKVNEASSDEKLDMVMSLLTGDANALGEYFSNPVSVEDRYVYEIANYGSGVAPFYTTLAIWVGMTILVSLIKVHANTEDLTDPKPHELFFGRYLLFFLLSQIQTAIIVLGDLYIFGIQCLDPLLFYLAAAMTSFTFSLIIYSLTISFGDIGKALAVVIMVVQIAGSGGTYPIESLPSFFGTIYRFLPFPHAIDAMRECIGGFYGNTYALCLAKLAIFCAAALFVGLLVRLPMIGLTHYMEKRMEDTEMM